MKRCPKCSRTYADDNQKFCTVDGGRLESAPSVDAASAFSPTIITNQDELNLPPPNEPATDLNKTMAALPPPPTGEIRSGNTGRTDNRTIMAPFQPADSPSQQQQPPPPPPQQSPQQPYRPAPPDYQQQRPPQQQPPPYQQGQQQQQQPYQQQYQQQQYQQPPPAQQPPHMAAPVASPEVQRTPKASPAGKGSRMPLIIGAVVLLLLAGAAAYYFLVLNKKSDAVANTNSNANVANANTNANANSNANANANSNANANANVAPPYQPPPNTTQFVNNRASLSGKIAERFAPFSFYYPSAWELNTNIASEGTYFVRVERKLPPNYVQERFTVGWYESNGTYDSDESLFPDLVETAGNNLSKLPGYEKLSEGPTKVNSMKAYQITFKGLSENTDKGDVTYWGRVIFLPPGVEGQKTGLQLTILTSSLATELEGIEDVGVKGELPVILESFRLK